MTLTAAGHIETETGPIFTVDSALSLGQVVTLLKNEGIRVVFGGENISDGNPDNRGRIPEVSGKRKSAFSAFTGRTHSRYFAVEDEAPSGWRHASDAEALQCIAADPETFIKLGHFEALGTWWMKGTRFFTPLITIRQKSGKLTVVLNYKIHKQIVNGGTRQLLLK